jgi:hypothetical protein
MSSLQVVKDAYERFGRGDIASLMALFDPRIEWRLAEGHPYSPKGEVWIGPQAVAENFFAGGVASGMVGSSRRTNFMWRPRRLSWNAVTRVSTSRPARTWISRPATSRRSPTASSRASGSPSTPLGYRR